MIPFVVLAVATPVIRNAIDKAIDIAKRDSPSARDPSRDR